MQFDPPLTRGVLLRRYKRFLADVRLADGSTVTAHCPDPGSMLGIAVPGRPVALSHSASPRRRLPYTLEMIDLDGVWVGVHTGRTNAFVAEAVHSGAIAEIPPPAASWRREVVWEDSRFDFHFHAGRQETYLEVKSVTLRDGRGRALFPDSVTVRGQKHLRTLMRLATAGHRAVMLYWVNRSDCSSLSPADSLDAEYGRLMRAAKEHGVELLAYRARVAPKQVTLDGPIPILL
jgi:sugar fermentation stimulation protein A